MFKKRHLGFVLANLIALFILQPGAVGIAGFDAPYGFIKDLTTWLSAYIGVSFVFIMYLAYKIEKFGTKFVAAYGALVVILTWSVYSIQFELFKEHVLFEMPFENFLIASLITAFMTVISFPFAIFYIFDVYSTASYMAIMNIAILILIVLLFLKSELKKRWKTYVRWSRKDLNRGGGVIIAGVLS